MKNRTPKRLISSKAYNMLKFKTSPKYNNEVATFQKIAQNNIKQYWGREMNLNNTANYMMPEN